MEIGSDAVTVLSPGDEIRVGAAIRLTAGGRRPVRARG